MRKLLDEGRIKYHPKSDVAVVKIGMVIKLETGELGVKMSDGVVMMKEAGIVCIDVAKNVKLFDKVLESNDVFVFGYPTSISSNNPLLGIKLPLLRKGIVAGKNDKLNIIILECPIYQGFSGGLVLEVKPKLGAVDVNGIGLITNFVPFRNEGSKEIQNSGYSVAVPFDKILELLND